MTTPVPADLDDRLARLDARIEAVEAELARWRGAAQPYWQPPRPPAPAPPPWTAVPPPPRPVPAPRRAPDWSRLPVWAGAGVTFVGVVLLLVLAASADWFGPLARVWAGAGLGVALLALAGWLVRRVGRASAGPSALAGTGATVLFASVAAATSLYELLPAVAGLVLSLVVAGAGIALADRWDSTRLAVGVLVGAELALIVVAGDLDALSLGLALVVQLGVVPTALRRAPLLASVAAGATALHGLLAGPFVAVGIEDVGTPVLLLAVAVLALVLGVASAVLGGLRGARAPAVLGIVAAPVPLLGALPAVGTATAVGTTLAAAVATVVAAYPRSVGRGVRVAAVSVAALLLAAATARWLDGVPLAGVLLAESLVLLGPAAWLRSRPVQLAGAWLALLGGIAALGTALDPASVREPLRDAAVDLPDGALLVAALLAVVAVVALVAALRTGTPATEKWAAWAWLPVAAGLYGVIWLVVAGAQLVVPGENGFTSGHVLVTLAVTALGVALLTRGLHRRAAGRTGFALIVAALAKLVLFDLVTLDGLARVTVFIGAGLVLLAVGTWFAGRAGPAGDTGPGQVAGTVGEGP